MELPQVRLIDDPILRQKCVPVEGHHYPLLPGLVYTMIEVMKREDGAGLAANQIGSCLAVFVLNVHGNNEEFINPEVVSMENLVEHEEGCLSIPGAFAKTQRYNRLTLRYNRLSDGAQNIRHETTYEGLIAIAIQHEMDHLNGKLYIDQFGPVKRGMVLDKHRKYLKAKARHG